MEGRSLLATPECLKVANDNSREGGDFSGSGQSITPILLLRWLLGCSQ